MKIKELLNREISLIEGILMIISYPIYLLIFDYVKYEIITFLMSVVFLLGIRTLYKFGGEYEINEKGKRILVRNKEKKINYKELLKQLKEKINMKSKILLLTLILLATIKTSNGQETIQRIIQSDSTIIIKSEEIKIGLTGFIKFYWFQHSKDSLNVFLLYTSSYNSNGKAIGIKTDVGRYDLPIIKLASNAMDYSMAYISKNSESYKALLNSSSVQWMSFPLVSTDGTGLEMFVGKNRKLTIEYFKAVANAKF